LFEDGFAALNWSLTWKSCLRQARISGVHFPTPAAERAAWPGLPNQTSPTHAGEG